MTSSSRSIGNEPWLCGMPSALGQNWLLLRGLSRESAHWGEFLPLLRSRFPGAQISTLDLPGTGSRYREISPSRIADICDAVRAEAIARGLLQSPLTIVGLSLGGMVVWEWLQRFPDEIAGAVLINTSFAGLSPFYQRLRWQSYPQIGRVLLQSDSLGREEALIRCVVNRRDLDEQLFKAWGSIQTERPVALSNTCRQLIAAARYRPDRRQPIAPVLLLGSRSDRLVAPACTEAIHKQWQFTLCVHPWGGHDLSTDDGPWVADRLEHWLGRLSSGE